MNTKETKKVIKCICISTFLSAFEQQNSLILYVGELQDLGNFHVSDTYFPFIFTHLN